MAKKLVKSKAAKKPAVKKTVAKKPAVKKRAKKSATITTIKLDRDLPEIEDRKDWEVPTKYFKKDAAGKKFSLIDSRRPSQTFLVDNIRSKVDSWRDSSYNSPKGISETSRTLLEFWFDSDHVLNGEIFRFRFAQREAVETVIYLYEVEKVLDNALLAEMYMDEMAFGSDMFAKDETKERIKSKRSLRRKNPANDKWIEQELPPLGLTRYCCKAATGSGKTNIMGFIAAWSYFHKKFETNSPLSRNILIIAPNVIVYERLKTDFEFGAIFKRLPLIPDVWKTDFQMDFIMREDTVKSGSDGALYLTNIHQIYESRLENNEVTENPITNILGKKVNPSNQNMASWFESLLERIMKHNELLIINDEAHHVHDEDLAWYKSILTFHENLKKKKKFGLSLLLDLSATPKDSNGTYFPWIISDYPLAQAIEDKIVKRPILVRQTTKKSPDKKTKTNAYKIYEEWIKIALFRYKEHETSLKKASIKPVLFVMAEDTTHANQIAEGIRKRPGFTKQGEVLVIHTKPDGTINETATSDRNKKELEELRDLAKSIDKKDSKAKVIISVLMLREGWDVKNVSIILGLRPFNSDNEILPEQTIGRGLRLMDGLGSAYTQILEIIGTDKFEDFVLQLEEEGVGFGITSKKKSKETPWLEPSKLRGKFNIEVPVLTATFSRKIEGLSSFNVHTLNKIADLSAKGVEKEAKLILDDSLTGKKVGTKQVTIKDDDVDGNDEPLVDIFNAVKSNLKYGLPFNIGYKIIKDYVRYICFGKEVDLEDEIVKYNLKNHELKQKIAQLISRNLGELMKPISEYKLHDNPISMIELDGFFWKRNIIETKKSVFPISPVFNLLESGFALFLEKSSDVERFICLAETYTKFNIAYLNKNGSIGLYYPDFIAVQKTKEGIIHWVIETKGYEEENVKYKDQETINWCKKATEVTGDIWRYLKVSDALFRGSGKTFKNLAELIKEVHSSSSEAELVLAQVSGGHSKTKEVAQELGSRMTEDEIQNFNEAEKRTRDIFIKQFDDYKKKHGKKHPMDPRA
jgi:type III restriction enzyme